jgi:7-cyano-7-deazaguanine synthase
MDSATLLAWAVKQIYRPACISVDYGQRHRRELDSARALAKHYRCSWNLINATESNWLLKGSCLSDVSIPVPHGHFEDESMKLTVVPNRNMLLLAHAGALAVGLGVQWIFYGPHKGDYAIYPDCRPAFIQAMRQAFAVCHFTPIYLRTPFLELDKGGICELGVSLGVPFDLTWSCYEGGDKPCGKCGACVERAEAFAAAKAIDPLL